MSWVLYFWHVCWRVFWRDFWVFWYSDRSEFTEDSVFCDDDSIFIVLLRSIFLVNLRGGFTIKFSVVKDSDDPN